jgi:hypothetical protein
VHHERIGVPVWQLPRTWKPPKVSFDQLFSLLPALSNLQTLVLDLMNAQLDEGCVKQISQVNSRHEDATGSPGPWLLPSVKHLSFHIDYPNFWLYCPKAETIDIAMPYRTDRWSEDRLEITALQMAKKLGPRPSVKKLATNGLRSLHTSTSSPGDSSRDGFSLKC